MDCLIADPVFGVIKRLARSILRKHGAGMLNCGVSLQKHRLLSYSGSGMVS